MMEELSIDLLLHIVQYLNVAGMSKMCHQSRRWYYIIHQYQRILGPQCVSFASYKPDRSRRRGRRGTHLTSTEVYNHAISNLQGPPQVCLSFSTSRAMRNDSRLHPWIARRSPKNMVTLAAVADTIQTAGIRHSRGSDAGEGCPIYERESRHALTMLSGLSSNACVESFFLEGQNSTRREAMALVDEHFVATLIGS
jgi:hypothetical protein